MAFQSGQRKLPAFLLFFFIFFCHWSIFDATAQQTGTNFLITAGRDASPSDGDSLFRAVYFIRCPLHGAATVHLRVFDADIGGVYDQTVTQSMARYRLFGKGAISPQIRSIQDPLGPAAALIDLEIGENELYDNQWRTLGSFRVEDGELKDSVSVFQLVVDGTSGSSFNLYQVFVSGEDKRNAAVEGLAISTPVVTFMVPASGSLATQIPFRIPENAEWIDVSNFDGEGMGDLIVQTVSRERVDVQVSQNGESRSTRIPILEEEKGMRAALIADGMHPKPDYIQCSMLDNTGKPVEFLLPVTFSPMNRLPEPRFSALPMSDCVSMVLDAAGTTDPDGDRLTFQWRFEGRLIGEGRRIVYRFDGPGAYLLELSVQDNSGFPLDTRRLTQTVRVNSTPSSRFSGPAVGEPLQDLEFDGSRSSDRDGRIEKFHWDFGDGLHAEGMAIRHRYVRAGRYRVTLRVEDDSRSFCASAETSAVVWINSPPVVRTRLKERVAVGEEVRMDGSGSIDSDGEIIRASWDFGDGKTEEGISVTHRYAAPGIYKVKLRAQDNAGVGNSVQTDTASLFVNTPPVAAGSVKPVVAAGEQAVFDASGSRDPDGRLILVEWDLGDGSVMVGRSVRHAYQKPGAVLVRLRVKDDSGVSNNEAEARFPVRINAPPVPDAGGDRLVNTSEVFFDAGASRDEDDPIILYRWDFGDGQSATGLSVRHVYSLPGVYRVRLTVTDGSGTSSSVQSDEIRVTVNHPPIADAGKSRTVSPGENTVFDGSFSSDPDGRITEFRWEPEPGVVKTGKRVNHAYARPGTYQALLFVQDDAGAEDVHATTVVVNAQPVPRIAPVARKAPREPVAFDASGSYDPDGRIIEAKWDFGDGSPPADGLLAAHAYAKPGVYPVVLTVRDDSRVSNSAASASGSAFINHVPVPEAGENRDLCSQTILFDGSRSRDEDQDPLVLKWDFGDSSTATGLRTAHTYARPGVYLVRLKADDGTGLRNGVAETFVSVHIHSAPDAHIDAPTQACAGENVLFDANRSTDADKDLLRFDWDFGDGTRDEGANPVHAYKLGGYYTVQLAVTDNSGLACNTGLDETVIRIVDAPVAQAGEDKTVCANTAVFFDGSRSSGGSRPIQGYEWNFGDGQLGGGVRTFHTFPQSGTYTVQLKITVPPEGNCENYSEDELTVQVLQSPVASFSADPSGCTDRDIVFDASASNAGATAIIGYAWDFGDSTFGEGVRAVHRYARPGSYTARLTVRTAAAGECNTASTERAIKINAKPVARIEIGPIADRAEVPTPRDPVTFHAHHSEDPDGFIRKAFWNFGDGGSAAGMSVTHRFAGPGRFRVKLNVEDNSGTPCGTDTASMAVSVVEPPAAWTFEGPEIAWPGRSVVFSAQAGEADSVSWTFGDGSTADGNRVEKTYPSPGIHQVQALRRGVYSVAKQIRVKAFPSISVPERTDADVNETLAIVPVIDNPERDSLAFRWDFGDGTRGDRALFRHAYAKPGPVQAVLTVGLARVPDGPAETFSVSVMVHARPDIAIRVSPDTLYSGGARDDVSFLALPADTATAYAFRWDFGDGQYAEGLSAKHSYARPGSYSVRLAAKDASRPSAKTYEFEKRIRVISR